MSRWLDRAAFLVMGFALAAVCLFSDRKPEIELKIPVADLLNVVLAVVALVVVPRALARLERTEAFDRELIRQHLTPALADLSKVEDQVLAMTTDQLDPATRSALAGLFRSLRLHIYRTQRVAMKAERPRSFIDALESAQSLAGNLFRLATDKPFSRRRDVGEVAAALTDELVGLMRGA